MNSDSGFIELCGSDVNEPEGEENKKEKDDKLPIYLFDTGFHISEKTTCIFLSESYLTLRHSSITTPPPESTFFIS